MRLALALARENVIREGGGPFGAAVFELGTGGLVAAGVNSVVRLRKLRPPRRDDGADDRAAGAGHVHAPGRAASGPRAGVIMRAVRDVPRRDPMERRPPRRLRRSWRRCASSRLRRRTGLRGYLPLSGRPRHRVRARRIARGGARRARALPRARRPDLQRLGHASAALGRPAGPCFHLRAERLEPLAAELLGALEHFLFFLVDVVLDELREDRHLGLEAIVVDVHLGQLTEDELHDVVLLVGPRPPSPRLSGYRAPAPPGRRSLPRSWYASRASG